MSLPKLTYDDAADFVREAAWGVEARFLWRGERFLARRADAAQGALDKGQDALDRAQRSVAPLQRLIQTKVTWPLTDRLRDSGTAARAGIATAAVAAAVAASAAGAMTAAPDRGEAPGSALAHAEPAALVETATPPQTLQGVEPVFEAAPAKAPPPPALAPAPPAAPAAEADPAQVAWRFAQAFARYEVGKASPRTAAEFAATADKALAKSLSTNPPRLPSKAKVPEARVLNVVLADRSKNQVTASVSLSRLRSVSEIRMTMARTKKDGWRVVQVLG
jgi:hypothetical protein